MRIEIRTERTGYADRINVYAFDRDGRTFVRDIILDPYTEGEYLTPSFSLDMTAAQLLIDELWRCGLRPSEGSGSAGSLAATERHLKDMQRLVFDHFCGTSPLKEPR